MAKDYLIETISKESLEQINQLVQRIESGIEGVIKMNKEFKNLKLPSEISQGFSAVSEETKKSNKVVSDAIKLQTKLENSQKSRMQAMTSVNREVIRNREETKRLNKELRNEERLLSKNTSVYDKVNLKLNKLIRTYRDLAIRKEAGRKLSLREEAQFASLEKRIFKYDRALKKVDAQSGRFNRSVGSYGKQFDGLGFSIAQITREAPAFANSMQTGFMAISNNIPMAIDEIQKLRIQNKALAAEGKPTKNVLRSIGAAIFSWQTLLSVGVTLLTVYGDEIVKWASDLGTGASAADNIAKSTEKVNEEANKLAGESIGKFQALIKVINDETRAEEQRLAAKKELASDYPDFNQKILDEANATDLVNFAIDDYLKKLQLKAKAQAALSLVQEKYTELLKSEAENEKFLNKITNTDLSKAKTEEERNQMLQRRSEILENLKTRAENEAVSRDSVFNTAKQSVDKYNDSLEEQGKLQEEINALLNVYSEGYEGPDPKKINQTIKKNEKQISIIDQLIQKEKDLNEEIKKRFESGISQGQSLIEVGISEADVSTLEEYQRLREKKNKTDQEAIQLARQEAKAMEILGEAFGRLETTLGIQQGTFETILDGIRFGFDDAGEAAKAFGELAIGAFAKITEASNIRLENEARNLEIEKDTALEFAGDSAAARTQIEERFDERQKEIRQKQAKNERTQALFNIAIGTAEGIINTIGNVGFPAAIPLIAAIGAIGLAQAAIVSSTPIPQFKDGVRNFEGGKAILGDGGVSEYVRTPDNKVFRTPAKDTLYNLPKGTDVYKNEADFNNSLNNILGDVGINPLGNAVYGRGVNPVPVVVNSSSGITDAQLRKALQDTIGKQSNNTTLMDKKGFSTFISKGHSRREVLNNQVTFKGKSV